MNKATQDQIAAVMLLHGTPLQKEEASRYIASERLLYGTPAQKEEALRDVKMPESYLTMILQSVQDGEITVSRARECIEAGGNFKPHWLPAPVGYFGDELPIDVCKRLKAQLESTGG